MDYKLYEGIDRRNTKCAKWDMCPEGVLPMWVADMDFPCAPGIMEALQKRTRHAAFGYTCLDEEDRQAIIDYYGRNHGVKVTEDDLLFTPGVVKSLLLAIHSFTQPGEKVLIQTPVYNPFYDVIRNSGRTMVENPLVEEESGKWEMNLEDLDSKLEDCKLMLLCSPHNPCGRVWPRETLQQVLNLCKKHNVYLMVDQIHCDFNREGFKQTDALTLDGADKGVATAVSATKSFNIAGLDHSTIFAPDPEMREKMRRTADAIGMGCGNLLGVLATTAAYQTGDEWLRQVKEIIYANYDLAVKELTAAGAKVVPLEGTYLALIDLRFTGKTCDELYDLFLNESKVRLNKGSDYGKVLEGFMRLNLATTPDLMKEGLRRLCETIRTL